MAESQAEQIVAKVKTQLEAIDDWYKPDKVSRVDYWSRNQLVPKYDSLYLVRAARNRAVDSAFGEGMMMLDIFLLCAQQDKAAEQDPHRRTVASGTLRNRQIQDARNKLESDRSLGKLAITLDVLEEDLEMDAPEGWVVSELYVPVQYDYTTGTS